MSTKVIAKPKPLPRRQSLRNVARKRAEAPSPLIAMLDRIAERGRSIPPEVSDAIWDELKAKDFCAGSGPIPHAE